MTKSVSREKIKSSSMSMWKYALTDAEDKLRHAKVEVLKWEAAVQTCREKIEKNAPWPATQT